MNEAIETLDRPEIGRFDFHDETDSHCTGTLIRPDVVLTAAHCFDFETGLADSRVEFVIHTTDGESYPFHLRRVRSLGGADGMDAAIVELREPVHPDMATPTHIAGEALGDEDHIMTLFGYGCVARDERGRLQTQVKRYQSFAWRDRATQSVCRGDSGAPVVVGRHGGVFAMAFGQRAATQTTVYVPVGSLAQDIEEQIAEW